MHRCQSIEESRYVFPENWIIVERMMPNFTACCSENVQSVFRSSDGPMNQTASATANKNRQWQVFTVFEQYKRQHRLELGFRLILGDRFSQARQKRQRQLWSCNCRRCRRNATALARYDRLWDTDLMMASEKVTGDVSCICVFGPKNSILILILFCNSQTHNYLSVPKIRRHSCFDDQQ